jgi:hypothetical protein
MIEGSGSVPRTNGSISGRPKNIRFLRIRLRIRIRNTGYNHEFKLCFGRLRTEISMYKTVLTSVADPDVFGPLGPRSVNQRYKSGSFYHQAKIVGKRFLLFCDFFVKFYL